MVRCWAMPPPCKKVQALILGLGPFYVEVACSPSASVGSLQVLQLSHTVSQKTCMWGELCQKWCLLPVGYTGRSKSLCFLNLHSDLLKLLCTRCARWTRCTRCTRRQCSSGLFKRKLMLSFFSQSFAFLYQSSRNCIFFFSSRKSLSRVKLNYIAKG